MASSPFVAEIALFPFNFPPTGWAFCNGQLLPISQNTALFSLLGTYYGGDGISTFALPYLEGCCAIGTGQGQGLTERFLGEQGGSDNVTLLISEIPTHTHTVQTSLKTGGTGVTANPIGNYPTTTATNLYSNTAGSETMTPLNVDVQVQPTGSSVPHNNMQPYLTINFCIALQGIFPPR
ncbi:phage tail protein [Flavihumibacter sp. R14]|nr:phage tail protein [Flavihumibacter soli]